MNYTVPPITDGQELLTRIRDSLRTSMNLALDGTTRNTLDPRDALGLIYNDLAHTLAVVKASASSLGEFSTEETNHPLPMNTENIMTEKVISILERQMHEAVRTADRLREYADTCRGNAEQAESDAAEAATLALQINEVLHTLLDVTP